MLNQDEIFTAKRHFHDADAYYEQGKLNESVEEYRKALNIAKP